jgi:hypothetical protein
MVLGSALNKSAIETLLLMCAVVLLPVIASASATSVVCSDTLLRKIPPREPAAATGSEFVDLVEALTGSDREDRIEAEFISGDLPQFLRKLVPVAMRGALADGRNVEITICVLPDYLAIGSNQDFLTVPMRLATALSIANHFGFTLPTSKMVDAIYDQADVHLAPQALPAGDEMRSTTYYWRHNELIAEQRMALGVFPGVLTAGHKKDLVLTNRLRRHPDRVAIYGWHRGANSPIQPLSTVHGWRYADYSHGVRLVSTTICVDGKPMSIFDALADPGLSQVLSGEGPLLRATDLIRRLASFRLDVLPTYFPPESVPSNDALDNVDGATH